MRKIYTLLIALTVAMIAVDFGNVSIPAHAVLIGVVRGALIIVDLYIAFMWIYFLLRKKIQARYVAEIIVIAAVIAFSVTGKMLISYFNEVGSGSFVDVSRDAWDSTAKFYYALYQALGGISFEGLAEYGMYETWRTMAYAGSSLIAGLVAISILTFSISYEIYSYFAWANFGSRNRSKIYVFTSVTEDSVALAHSIDSANREKRKAQTLGALIEEEKEVAKVCGESSSVAVYLRAVYRRIFRRRRYAIIFLRTEGEEGFDGKNALHADIMHSGFLFRSYNPGRKNKSIARFLHIRLKNDGCLEQNGSKKYDAAALRDEAAELHVFSLDWEKGKTSENDNLVFGDISRVTAEVFGRPVSVLEKLKYGKNREKEEAKEYAEIRSRGYRRITDYHYLVSEEIDLPNVDMRFDNEMAKFCDTEKCRGKKKSALSCLAEVGAEAHREVGKDKPEYADFYAAFKRHFGLYAINEANMASMMYVKERAKLIEKYPDVYKEDINSDKYNAMFVGFGQNGQQTLKAAYVFAAAGRFPEYLGEIEDKDESIKRECKDEWLRLLRNSPISGYRPQPFYADVYDKNADDLGGLFKMKHPSFAVVLPQNGQNNVADETDGSMGGFYKQRKQLVSSQSPRIKAEEYPNAFIPVRIRLHQDSAYSETILRMLDRNLGENISRYNLIVVALGDDDSNVNIANALLEDCKREFSSNTESGSRKNIKNQVFAINLRDKLNFDRINWCAKDERDYPKLKVIIYGSAEDMYSYENLVDNALAKRWNSGYSAIQSDDQKEVNALTAAVERTLGRGEEISIGSYLRKIDEKAKNAALTERDWRSLGNMSFYSRNSSRCAADFSPFVVACYKAAEGENAKEFPDVSLRSVIRLGAVEHDRWVRYVAVNGYVYGKNKNKHIKTHPDIVPYGELDSQLNDMTNIFNAFAVEYAKKCEQNGVEPY